MNDYDHDHPSKASFATHAGNKIRGLQQAAMKNQDSIPSDVRQAQKKFQVEKPAQAPAPVAAQPKVDLHTTIAQTNHPDATNISDRLKRVGASRAAQTIRQSARAAQPVETQAPKKSVAAPIAFDPMLDEGEEEQ